jgi:urease accessory protein
MFADSIQPLLWRPGQRSEKPALPRDTIGRSVEGQLRFALGGGRTVLAHQHLPYPLHVTRPFYLDSPRPQLATLYLQSASGGLYRGDRIALRIDLEPGAAAHVTTQASTIVHDTRGIPAVHLTRIVIARDALAVVTPDPFVMFPGAAVVAQTEIAMAPTATLISAEGLFHHDPSGQSRAFDCFSSETIVRDLDGTVLALERGAIAGHTFLGRASPLGRFRAAGVVLFCGRGADRLHPGSAEASLSTLGCFAGATATPNAAGLVLRILASDGGQLARGLEAAISLAFEAALGTPPARRRK